MSLITNCLPLVFGSDGFWSMNNLLKIIICDK